MLLLAIMDMEWEEQSGPKYHPITSGVYKWPYQRGKLYIGD
ncbi:MAG TPA: hypothetical protein PLW88_08130 [Syntrophorhabdaceae bacterium]|nr:hypothetical protein [Syntrophorhabdaceae bacterium]